MWVGVWDGDVPEPGGVGRCGAGDAGFIGDVWVGDVDAVEGDLCAFLEVEALEDKGSAAGCGALVGDHGERLGGGDKEEGLEELGALSGGCADGDVCEAGGVGWRGDFEEV